MINLPVAIATAMASATLPSIVASFTIGDHKRVKGKIDTVLKINMLIAIPSAVGLATLADPIMAVLFPRLNEYHDLAVILIMTGSSAVVFYALSTLTTSILQGCNRMNVPVIHSGISLVIHGILVASLLYYTNLGVYALVIGNVSFPLVVCLLNVRSVKKLLEYSFDVKGIFIKPLFSALVMGLFASLTYKGLIALCGDAMRVKIIGLIIAFIVAIVTYGIVLLLTGEFAGEESKNLPLIGRFFRKK